MGKKYHDYHWDFRGEDTKRYTHCFHSYPAMMIPQIAGELIERYGCGARALFDPYCGTGSSLVEAALRGIDSVGTDLNPLARLISKAKTSTVSPRLLERTISEFGDISLLASFGQLSISENYIPNFPNRDFWFSQDVQKQLSYILEFIRNISNGPVRDLFLVAFSETVRECSWTRNGEFKLYRMTEEKRAKFSPDAFSIMQTKLLRIRRGVFEYMESRTGKASIAIHGFNTVQGIPVKVLSNQSIDIVITSPPYGDSRTTVAYGQYSRLSSEWIGLDEPAKVDRMLMGGTVNGHSLSNFAGITTLKSPLNQITQEAPKRAREVLAFYHDYKDSIANVAKVIKRGGFACYVVGNRRVKGATLPTDEITIELFESAGFKHIETIVRNIPNKRMPSKNSPSNVTGVKGVTMTNEYIIVMKRK